MSKPIRHELSTALLSTRAFDTKSSQYYNYFRVEFSTRISFQRFKIKRADDRSTSCWLEEKSWLKFVSSQDNEKSWLEFDSLQDNEKIRLEFVSSQDNEKSWLEFVSVTFDSNCSRHLRCRSFVSSLDFKFWKLNSWRELDISKFRLELLSKGADEFWSTLDF